jgi:hypothetical protein
VQTLIVRRCGVKLSIHAVGEYLTHWGYTPQKPLKRACERDEARVHRWLSSEYPAIAQSWPGCAPQVLDTGRTDAVAGPSASRGMIVV